MNYCHSGRCLLLTAALLVSTGFSALEAREASDDFKQLAAVRQAQRLAAAPPRLKYAVHNRGNVELVVGNNGTFGTFGDGITDPLTNQTAWSCRYPKNSDIVYLWVGAFWIGAVVGKDTLVSCGSEDYYATAEFWSPDTGFTYQSIDLNSPLYSSAAYSEQDISCMYTDTFTDPTLVGQDDTDRRSHRPLGIEISQRSMAWSYDYADDFVLFDYGIRNSGSERLDDVYIGIWVDGDVWHISNRDSDHWEDDIVGFRSTFPSPEDAAFLDTVNMAWHADNDGDPTGGAWDYRSGRDVMATRVVRTPADSLTYSFNWWITNYSDPALDFGPRMRGTNERPFRAIGSGLGTPQGDRNKYYLMSHPEFDYDLLFTAQDHSFEGFMSPPGTASVIADGFDTRYLLSFGPFDIEPGQNLPVSFAWVGGRNLHVNPSDFTTYWDSNNPRAFYNELDFSNLALNARWASWIYDNPGVDTDRDGYRGKFRLLNGVDTFWTEGDNVPDFKGAGPPPAPKLKVVPSLGKLHIRWNGFYSENTPDPFLNLIDFEGYRVYLALDDRDASFTLLTSYDYENFNRYYWKQSAGVTPQWVLLNIPFTLTSLKQIYGDSFSPDDYPRSSPLYVGDSAFYFEPNGFNQSDLRTPNGIHRAFPDAVNQGRDPANWTTDQITTEHGEPLPKYYEYEYVADNLLPTISYIASVTVFDFGSPIAGLAPLETPPLDNSIREYPQTPSDVVESENLDVYVYPNPYTLDSRYDSLGFENRKRNEYVERARRIHFANLPAVCKISIFTLDGDLVDEVHHDFPGGGPESMHDTWDLISRNTQSIVSGIYYYVVESATRTQIGKFVIIM